MVAIVEDKRMALAELCHRYGVERLYLFGSGATGRFDTHRSDLDFLVCFANREPTGEYADRSWICGRSGTAFRPADRSGDGAVDPQPVLQE